mgnify:CR=1 FL=1
MAVEEIIKQLEDSIKNFDHKTDTVESGSVVSVNDGIVKVSGLSGCMSSEMIKIGDSFGLALNLEEDSLGVVILGSYSHIKEGDVALRTGKVLSVGVSDEILGRVVDPLITPLDGESKIKVKKEMEIDRVASGVMDRKSVDVPMQTGIKVIDCLVPVGRGQRELIIGDRQTGKTSLTIDTIVNQKGKGVICVYVAIGQKKSKVVRVVQELTKRGAMEYTTVVFAGASDSPSLLYLAPYSGVSIAEYFMEQGKDVLVVYDDLSKHANAYREISLLLRRPPGREAYPGDVFYLHSRLLERACRRNEESGGGSITALPIIETQGGDISAYIPTNVISITDGQIFLESSLFNKGVRPAINVGLSVSRVGGSAQVSAMKKNAGPMKLSLAQYRELESFSQFDSDVDPKTKQILDRGARTIEVLKQNLWSPLPVSLQVLSIFAVNNGFFDSKKLGEVREFESKIHEFFKTTSSDILEKIEKGWNDELKESILLKLNDFASIN